MSEDTHEEKVMYAASLVNDELIIREVGEGVYKRIGTDGLSNTKMKAVEVLRWNLMQKFQHDMKCVEWQAQQFVKTL